MLIFTNRVPKWVITTQVEEVKKPDHASIMVDLYCIAVLDAIQLRLIYTKYH